MEKRPNMSLFPTDIIQAAQASQAACGCWSSTTLAQWADESGYGRHIIPGSNNPFNVKEFGAGPYVESWTTEFINGKTVRVMAKFVKYNSMADAFTAHGQLLMDPKGPYARFLCVHSDAIKWTSAIARVYATNPNYGANLISIIGHNNLLAYDTLPTQPDIQPCESQGKSDNQGLNVAVAEPSDS